MNRLRFLAVPALAAVSLALVAAPADTLAFRAADKSKVTKTFTIKSTMKSLSFSNSVNGEEMGDGPSPVISVDDTETYKVTDEYLGSADGRPTKIRRTYDEIAASTTQTVALPDEMGGEDDESTRERSSELTGKRVLVSWDGKDESYGSAWDEGEKGDDALLADLRGEIELLAFLPSKPVADGDTWDIEGSVFNSLMQPLGDVPMKGGEEEGGPSAETQRELERGFAKNRTGKAKATYKGTREIDGQKYGVIELTADLDSKAEQSLDEGKLTIDSNHVLEGELLWDLAAGHVHSLKLSGQAKYTMHAENSFEGPQGSMDFKQKIEFGGSTEILLEVE